MHFQNGWAGLCECMNKCICDVAHQPDTLRMENSGIDFKKTVGKQVRKLRLKAGLTQDVLSERCGIYRTYLSRIEAGSANPTLLVMIALASTLGVHVCELFHDFDEASKDVLVSITSRQHKQ